MRLSFLVVALCACLVLGHRSQAAESHPLPTRTRYVSKLGDASDGTSWSKAFRTIQAALNAIGDNDGGWRIVVRPDTYMEANLFPARRGAAGAYNELVGDWDGTFGSGATGWVILDSSDPEKGFKSYDWWGPISAYKHAWSPEHKKETFSAIGWDRWAIRRLYVSGGDAGLFFDLVDKAEPFSVRVEDCFSAGRAFGGGVANVLCRPGEPSVFRRCQLWCLDWWGDAAGTYVRAEHAAPLTDSDVFFDDCTLVGPDNALQAGNPGYSGYTRVSLKNCRLVSLNFSQPQGKPSTGVIFSTIEGKLLHVDLEDCTLMGCKIFSAGKGDVSYTTRGDVKAYVQFQQTIPAGMQLLDHWPAEVFQTLLPPFAPSANPTRASLRVDRPDLGDLCEVAPLVWHDQLALMKCNRPVSGGASPDYYLTLEDVDSGRQLARFGAGYGLASAFVHNGQLYVFASRFASGGWNDVTLLKSANLSDWTEQRVVTQEQEHLFNSSVCQGDSRFVMAYESDDPKYPAFTIKFAISSDVEHWAKLPDALFGTDRYAACPCLRYANGYYYLLYLEHRTPRWFFETYMARSKDLKHWDLSAANPILTPGLTDGTNASDPDLIEFGGKTYLYYSVGDQRTWSKLKRAVYPGPMADFFEGYFQTTPVPSK
jgi:hypothetical protein